MDSNTKAKTWSWIAKHFGIEGYYVINGGAQYGYGVTVSLTPEHTGHRFFVFKGGGTKKIPLGEFDTAQEAVDMLRLLIATERNSDGNAYESN